MDLDAVYTTLQLIEIDRAQTNTLADVCLALLAEIQHLQQRVTRLEEANPEAHLAEECQAHTCTYFAHYLAHGPADLTHEGYHEAEKKCAHWQQKVEDWYDAHQDDHSVLDPPFLSQCRYWEKAVRA